MATSVDAKLLKSTKFPIEFNQKVDMQKVNVEVLKKWIASRISEILGNEDDVVIELCFNLIEGARYPDIKKLQIQLTGFLDKDTAGFCKELWKLCLSAQSNAQGVPKELLEAKKLELIQEKIDSEKAADEARKRREDEQRRDRDINSIRDRERGERGRGGGGRGRQQGDSWRGGRGDDRRDFGRGSGWGFERRAPRYSRSPPRRRVSRERAPFRPRESDTYVPESRDNRRRDTRMRSPSRSISLSSGRSTTESRSPSPRSRSPPPRRRNRSPSRSPSTRRRRSRSPDRREHYRRNDTGRGRSSDRGTRRRSPVNNSLSRSPPPTRRRRSSSASLSRSPPSGGPSRRPISSSRSLSRSVTSQSLSRTPRRRSSRSTDWDRTSPASDAGANFPEPRFRYRDNDKRDSKKSRSITPPRKRRRSFERYGPSKRRRNTSSASADTVDLKADADDRRPISRDEESRHAAEMKDPQKQASELREKLLREKIKKMRTSSFETVNTLANGH